MNSVIENALRFNKANNYDTDCTQKALRWKSYKEKTSRNALFSCG